MAYRQAPDFPLSLPKRETPGEVVHDYRTTAWGHAFTVFRACVSGVWEWTGHGPRTGPAIEAGDLLWVRMTSGRGRFWRVVSIAYATDPPDQWFAEVRPLEDEDRNE